MITVVLAAAAGCRPGGRYVVWRKLDALWYADNEGKPSSGSSTLYAMVMKSREHRVRVGMFEEYAGAVGEQWRASIWMASFLANLYLGRRMTDRFFSIAVGGVIDGPSAGALMAVGFMSAIRGERLRENATLTGGLGPDGTVLPVGGIPEKIRAASKKGKTLVGIPAGQTMAKDAKGNPVKVIELGRKLGVEVRELSHLCQAYYLMTGIKIEKMKPLPKSMMRVSGSLAAKMKRRVESLLGRASGYISQARDLSVKSLKRMRDMAVKRRDQARKYLARGDVVAAYFDAFQAAALARASVLVNFLGSENLKGAPKKSSKETEKALKKLESDLEKATRNPGTKPLALLAAYGAGSKARGAYEIFRVLITHALKELKAKNLCETTLQAIKKNGKGDLPALYLSLADLYIEQAWDALRAPGELAFPVRLLHRRLPKLARSMISAASGSMKFIDVLILTGQAEEQKKSLDEVRAAFSRKEPPFLLALELAQLAILRGVRKYKTDHDSLMVLSNSIQAYVDSAIILTKYYGLESDLTESKQEEKCRRHHALRSLLESAELEVRVAAAQAHKHLGVVPPEVKLYHRAGEVMMHGDFQEKLQALTLFWRANVTSRIALMVLQKR